MSIVARLFAAAPYRRTIFRETETERRRKIVRNRVISVAAATMALVGLAGCGRTTVDVSGNFYGALAVEEPRAALLARDVLASGGSAADAAVVTYFALAATLPSSAGLGATGSCLVFDPLSGPRFERLDFYPTPASDKGPTIALPTGPRAMFALHARYGRTKFEELLIAAERLARFGEPVSRALALDLAASGSVLRADPATAAVFLPGGKPLGQQDSLVQIDLSAALGRLRGEGIGALYAGPMAKDMIAAAAQAGYAVDPVRLRDALPQWSTVEGLEHDNHVWAIAGQDAADTALSQISLAMVLKGADWNSGDPAIRRHLLTEALNRASAAVAGGARSLNADAARDSMAGYDARRRGLSASRSRLAETLGETGAESAGATGFYMVDRTGMAVGCAIGLGAPFGTGRLVPGFGFLPGRPVVASGDGPGAAALIVGNTKASQLHLAMASSGGRPAISALLQTALDHWELQEHLDKVVAAPRVHFAGGSNTMAVEPALPADERRELEGIGYKLAEQPELGRVNGFRCVEGIPRRELMCEAGVDPRSRGLGFFEHGG